MQHRFVAASFVATLLVSGCASSPPFVQSAALEKVALIEGKPSKSYTELKPLQIRLRKGPPQYGGDLYISHGKAALRAQASAIGADAVIQVKFHDEPINMLGFGPDAWGWIDASGIAVKFK